MLVENVEIVVSMEYVEYQCDIENVENLWTGLRKCRIFVNGTVENVEIESYKENIEYQCNVENVEN